MRLAHIADIYGNLVAREAVLAELDGEQLDQIICLGDIAATGPQPQAVVERVQQLTCPVIMGNADAELIGREPYPTGTAERFGAASVTIKRFSLLQSTDVLCPTSHFRCGVVI